MLQHLKQSGITILVSTPYMDEANLCDRIALIQEGKLMSVNTPAGVIQNFEQPLYAAKGNQMLHLLHDLKTFSEVNDAYPFGEYHHVVFKDEAGAHKVRAHFESSGVEMFPVTPDIEDCFMQLMKTNE
jgi:ABC-type multidrug transport system ATPase subunit